MVLDKGVSMDRVREILTEQFDTENSLFVFPSEIAAGFWRKEFLKMTGRDAVDPGRFVSWDKFKESSFALFRTSRPVNAVLRTIFAYSLLENNKADGTELAGIIAREYAGNSTAFLQYLVRILPSLNMVSEIPSYDRELSQSEFLGTLRKLYHRYEGFLSGHDLFEPGFETADLSGITRPVFIFFPEIIEDYPENRDVLEAHPRVRTVSCSEKSGLGDSFLLFSNSLHEFDWIFSRILRLLDEGVPYYDIAVTVCEEKILPYFQNEAEKYPLSFVFKGGRRITDYSAGKFFLQLREYESSGLHIDQLKKLLLSGGVPWKNRELLERIVVTGMNSYYLREKEGAEKNCERLLRGLEAAGDKSLADYFLSIHRGIFSIIESRTITSCKQAVIRFSMDFFDQGRWDETNKRVFEYALNMMGEIRASLDIVELPKTLRPFQLFLQLIQNSIYVPKSSAPGIPVYPYRVSAGIAVPYHFIVSAHHTATRVTSGVYAFLRKDLKSLLGIVDRDMSAEFLNVYAVSGKHAVLSCPEETFSEKTLVPSSIMERMSGFPEQAEKQREVNFFEEERQWWAGAAGAVKALFPVQRRGLVSIAEILTCPPEGKLTAHAIDDAGLRNNAAKGFRKNGAVVISPTALERYTRCPFSFLLDNLIGRNRPEYSSLYCDDRTTGRFLHEVLRVLFKGIHEKSTVYIPDRVDEYREMLLEAVDTVRRKFYGRGYVFLHPVESEMRGRTVGWIGELLELESRHFAGLEVMAAEAELSSEWQEGGNGPGTCMLRGKIDRLSGPRESAVLLDYKKRNAVSKKDITGTESEDPVSFQIPMYIFLAEENGISVSRAGYLSLSEARFYPVLQSEQDKKGWLTREEMEGCISRMHGYVGDMLKGIRNGYYPVPEEDCSPCSYRGVCREKFVIR